jgi:hypothetical protein
MHMNIHVFFQILNTLCSFWSTIFLFDFFPIFFGPVRFLVPITLLGALPC